MSSGGLRWWASLNLGNFVNETIGVVISFTFDKHLSLTRLRPSHFGGVLVNEGERATKRLMNEVVMPLGPAPYDSLLRSSPIKSVIKIVAAAVGIFRTHVLNGVQLLRTQFAAKMYLWSKFSPECPCMNQNRGCDWTDSFHETSVSAYFPNIKSEAENGLQIGSPVQDCAIQKRLLSTGKAGEGSVNVERLRIVFCPAKLTTTLVPHGYYSG